MDSKMLRDISSIQTGPFGSQLHNSDYVSSGIPIVTVEHLGKRRFATQNLPYVSQEDAERLSKYQMVEGDIIFSRVGSVDRCSFAMKENTGWLYSGRCLRVRPIDKVDSKWLYYYLSSASVTSYIRNIAVGATMPSINTSLLEEVPISKLPNLETQQRISAILSQLDSKIELNNQINDYLAA